MLRLAQMSKLDGALSALDLTENAREVRDYPKAYLELMRSSKARRLLDLDDSNNDPEGCIVLCLPLRVPPV